jgi:glycosyltransferase involved in cell wall biosynthesis
MGRLLADCALVIGNTPEATAAIAEAFPAVSKRNLTTITNGYDASDFIGIDTRPHDGRFRIVHAGYLHSSIAMVHRRNLATKRFLGGSLWPIDLLCRSHYYLLKGVSILEKEDPELASRIDIILAGVLSEQDEQIIRESPAGSRVRTLGYISHREAIQEMMLADALFLPMHSVPPGRRARIVPGKTYEYLASGRPILAAVPQGDAQDFIVEARAGLITDPSDARMIARGIRALSSGSVGARPIGDGVERFERRHLTQDLAERLTEL